MGALHYIVPIAIGAVIGYCTNYIAIKMLFRPHTEKYIGKFRVPFTPGIIPKNQKRLAGAIGDAVNDQLLTKDAVMESVSETGEKYISKLAAEISGGDLSVRTLIPDDAKREEVLEKAGTALSDSIMKKAGEISIETGVSNFAKDTIGALVSGSPMLGMLFGEDLPGMIAQMLGKAAQEYFNTRGDEAVRGFVSSYMKDIADKPVHEIIPAVEDQAMVQAALENALRTAGAKYGEGLLDQIDIRGIVTKRIEEMDVDELEELVLSVMKQELQAVINLGAVIGAVIGIINIFF